MNDILFLSNLFLGEYLLLSFFQVVTAFGHPEFFNSTFPLLFEMCNSAAPNKSGKATLASDAKAGAESVSIEILNFDSLLEM